MGLHFIMLHNFHNKNFGQIKQIKSGIEELRCPLNGFHSRYKD